jgi:magnesium transporter
MTDETVPPIPGSEHGGVDEIRRAAGTATTAAPPGCATRTRFYVDGKLADEGFPPETISELLEATSGSFVWLDLFEPQEADLAVVVQEFGLHPLAVEDAIHDHQRPKLDRYATHFFLSMYATAFDSVSGQVCTSELSAFVTDRALITVRKPGFDIEALVERWNGSEHLASNGVGFLVHGLLDAVVDGQYQAADELDDSIDELETALFNTSSRTEIRRRGFELRKSLTLLRRVIAPMREVLARLTRAEEDRHIMAPALEPYFQDVHDHVLRAAEDVEAAREHVASVLETNLNEQGNDLNEITKKLASWAAIIAVPTAVTGFYGQNVPYPGFGKEWGFAISCAVIVLLAGGIYLMLRRRGWL